MSDMKAAALAYAAKGWPVFPCRSDKTPYTEHGVTDATTDPAQIEAWWDKWPLANIAMNVGETRMMVLDFDPGHSMAEVEASVGKLPPTALRQRSPRGGVHLFYAIGDKEIVPPSASKIAPKVDVRSFNSYVLLAPSKTADGPYVWEEEGKPAYRTDAMVRVASSAKEKDANRDTWLIQPDLPENVALAIDWLKHKARPAIQGQGGDHTAYATAAMCKSFGLSDALAFDLIWEHYNPRCVPPWSAEEADHLAAKVRNGYSYNTSPPGNMTPAYHVARVAQQFQPVAQTTIPSGTELTAGRFRFVDREGAEHIKPASWLIDDCLPEGGHCLLVGDRGTFKSFLALDMALSVATGADLDPWLGLWPNVKRGPVLYVAGEGRSQFMRRVAAWEAHHYEGEKVKGFVLADPVPLVSMGQPDIDGFIAGALAMSPDGFPLTVIDTVGRAMQGLNENAQEHASNFTRLVEHLIRSLGSTVLSLHHTGKDGTTRGSSVFEADADTVLRVDRNPHAMAVKLSMTKQKDAPEWEKPKHVKLVNVTLAPNVTSLAAAMPTKVETEVQTPVANPAAEAIQLRTKAATLAAAIDQTIAQILQAIPTKIWTGAELATAVAHKMPAPQGQEPIAEKTLQNTYFPRLRATEGTHAHRCFTASRSKNAGQWQWSEK